MPLEDGRTRRALLKQAPAQFTLLAGIAVFSSSISRTQNHRFHGETVNLRAIGLILGMLLPGAVPAEAAWVQDQTVQQQLSDRQVAVRVEFDDGQSRIHVRAAVRINASPEAIWHVLTDCDHAASFIPGVKSCHPLEVAPDDSWVIVEQEAKYSWLMPAVKCVIRADYKRPRRIEFRRISGDLKQEEGVWLLEATGPGVSDPAPGPVTTVEYDLFVDPGFWIPRVLLRHSLRSELPAAFAALRTRVESAGARH
jgi:uncharacterized protein YndB with AHSA1/START domain